MIILLFILGFVLFISLVLIHEWGHFIASKKNGVTVEEFGLGFPPKAKSLGVHKGTEYTINWLPLGGFVKLKGEHDADRSKGSFGAASTKAKTLIMLAGVGMNLVTAFFLFTIVALIGMPNLSKTLGFEQFTVASDTKLIRDYDNKGVIKVESVVVGSPAEKAGIKSGDQIITINGIAIDSPEKLSEQTKINAGKTVAIATKSADVIDVYGATLNATSPYLGVSSYSDEYGVHQHVAPPDPPNARAPARQEA
jgi:regulator of sigma E protease